MSEAKADEPKRPRAKRRLWTDEEKAIIRDLYRKKTAEEIGAIIGRSRKSVQQIAFSLGIVEHRDPKRIAKRRELIRKYHAKGWSDSEIARLLKMERRTVGGVRKRLGLVANDRNERYRAKVAKRTKDQCKKAGVKNLAEVRVIAYRDFVRKLGWPEELSPRAAQFAELLYQHGPLTRRQISTLSGLPWRGSRKSLASSTPGGSYLAELQRAGLVVQLPKAVNRGGSGEQDSLYMLGMGVSPCRNGEESKPDSQTLNGLSLRSTK